MYTQHGRPRDVFSLSKTIFRMLKARPLPHLLGRSLLSSLLNVLFPFQCAGCGRHGAPVCMQCLTRPLARNTEQVPNVWAVFDYHDPRVTKLVQRMKYQGEWALAGFCADLMVRVLLSESRVCLDDAATATRTILVPVPLHDTRMAERGYNQSEKLARELGKRLGAPVLDLLRRTRPTSQQTRLTRTERIRNMHDAFERQNHSAYKSHVILVDDVVTTGSTLASCRAALAPIQHISALTFAHQALQARQN